MAEQIKKYPHGNKTSDAGILYLKMYFCKKRKKMKTTNTLLKAQIVQRIVDQNYEPGRQDRCRRWIYRNIVRKQLPMAESTFFRLLHTDTSVLEKPKSSCPRQLTLF